MIYITQLIYIVPGQEEIFDRFEEIAIPIIRKYNGRLLFRLRPDADSFIVSHIDKPFEIHFAEFDTEQDFKNFSQDKERKQYLHLKEKSIKASIAVLGTKL